MNDYFCFYVICFLLLCYMLFAAILYIMCKTCFFHTFHLRLQRYKKLFNNVSKRKKMNKVSLIKGT